VTNGAAAEQTWRSKCTPHNRRAVIKPVATHTIRNLLVILFPAAASTILLCSLSLSSAASVGQLPRQPETPERQRSAATAPGTPLSPLPMFALPAGVPGSACAGATDQAQVIGCPGGRGSDSGSCGTAGAGAGAAFVTVLGAGTGYQRQQQGPAGATGSDYFSVQNRLGAAGFLDAGGGVTTPPMSGSAAGTPLAGSPAPSAHCSSASGSSCGIGAGLGMLEKPTLSRVYSMASGPGVGGGGMGGGVAALGSPPRPPARAPSTGALLPLQAIAPGRQGHGMSRRRASLPSPVVFTLQQATPSTNGSVAEADGGLTGSGSATGDASPVSPALEGTGPTAGAASVPLHQHQYRAGHQVYPGAFKAQAYPAAATFTTDGSAPASRTASRPGSTFPLSATEAGAGVADRHCPPHLARASAGAASQAAAAECGAVGVGVELGPGGKQQAWSWDAGLSFTPTEGAGVSACEEAGYTWGSLEHGVRGKAGTPGFWAPEMLYYEKDGKGRRYGAAADWWSLGCLVYALLASRGPFTVIGGDTADDNAATLQNDPDLNPAAFSGAAISLLQGLLEKNPRKRLGCGPGGVAEVMAHPFFAGLDWVAVKNKQVRPPFRPMMNVLDSTKPVRGWSDKDKAKLAVTTLDGKDQVRVAPVARCRRDSAAASRSQRKPVG